MSLANRLRKRLGRLLFRVQPSRSVLIIMLAVLAAHLVFSMTPRPVSTWNPSELLLGVAYFIFGLFAALSIESAKNTAGRLQELLKAGTQISWHCTNSVKSSEKNSADAWMLRSLSTSKTRLTTGSRISADRLHAERGRGRSVASRLQLTYR